MQYEMEALRLVYWGDYTPYRTVVEVAEAIRRIFKHRKLTDSEIGSVQTTFRRAL
jgi:hypothetical protein